MKARFSRRKVLSSLGAIAALGVLATFVEFVLWLTGLEGLPIIPALAGYTVWVPNVVDYPIGLVSTAYVWALLGTFVFDWKGERWFSFNRAMFGWIAGALMLGAILLPWKFWIWNGYYYSSTVSDYATLSFGHIHLYLLVAGGLLSIVSRFGGFLTMAGMLEWSFIPTWASCPLGGCPPLYMGPGFWLAVVGLGLSLASKPLNLPLRLRRSKPGHANV